MILEPSRQLRIALEHAEYGVNKKLVTLEQYEEDAAPRKIVSIVDWTKDDLALVGVAGAYPALLVSRPEALSAKGEETTGIRDTAAGMRLSITLLTDATSAKTAAGSVEASLIVRAILQTLATWLSNDRASDRVANNVQIREATGIDWFIDPVIDEEYPSMALAGAVFVDVMVRDLTPEG